MDHMDQIFTLDIFVDDTNNRSKQFQYILTIMVYIFRKFNRFELSSFSSSYRVYNNVTSQTNMFESKEQTKL